MRRTTHYRPPPERKPSSETRWNKTNIIFTVLASIATVGSLLYAIFSPKDPPVTNIHQSNTGGTPQKTGEKTGQPDPVQRGYYRPPPPKEKEGIAATKGRNPAGLRIIYAGDLWQGDMYDSLANFFAIKGFQVSETSPEKNTAPFDKLVTAAYTITGTRKIDSDPAITEYTVQLSMQFYDENGKRDCGHRRFSQTVATSETDDIRRVARQAFSGLLTQLQQKDMPFHIN